MRRRSGFQRFEKTPLSFETVSRSRRLNWVGGGQNGPVANQLVFSGWSRSKRDLAVRSNGFDAVWESVKLYTVWPSSGHRRHCEMPEFFVREWPSLCFNNGKFLGVAVDLSSVPFRFFQNAQRKHLGNQHSWNGFELIWN